MLRVGLTGDLGSGKSTVAALFASFGAAVFSSDEMARTMMQPGQAVHTQIVDRFGHAVVAPDGTLDRRVLARLAFEEGRVEELNAIVHPAVLAGQARLLEELANGHPHAIAVVESALIFSARHGAESEPWRTRFDRVVLVRAPLQIKVARFVARLSAGRTLAPEEQAALAHDARTRLALQSGANDSHASECLLIENGGDTESLRDQAVHVWSALRQAEAATG